MRSQRFVVEVTVYARALGVALAQTSYDTHESSEREPTGRRLRSNKSC